MTSRFVLSSLRVEQVTSPDDGAVVTTSGWHAAIVPTIAIAWVILLFVPFDPTFTSAEIAGDWAGRMTADLLSNSRFGVETIFSYGPLAFIPLRYYYPGNFVLLLAVWLVLVAGFVTGVRRVFADAGVSARASWLGVMALAAVLSAQLSRVGTEPFLLFLIAILIVLLQASDEARPALPVWMVMLSLSIVSLGKFSYMVVGGVVIATIEARRVLKRRLPVLLVAYVTAIVLLWVATGQRLGDFAAYLSMSLEITRGYTEAMTVVVPGRNGLVFTVISAALLFATRVPGRDDGWGMREVFTLATWSGFLLLVVKTGIVRQDEHVLSVSIVLIALSTLFVIADTSALRRALATVALVSALVGAFVMLTAFADQPAREPFAQLSKLDDQVRVIGRTLTDSGWLEREHERRLARRDVWRPDASRIEGSIDVYPGASLLPRRWSTEYRPRPLVMSYKTYTPRLAELDAAHVRGTSAPDWLLFAIGPIDGRHPALGDGASWPGILAGYDAVTQTSDGVLLGRRDTPRSIGYRPIMNDVVQFGETVKIGSRPGQLVWAKVKIHRTPWSWLSRTFLRSPVFTIRVTTTDGRSIEAKFVPGMGEAGFLVSPFVADAEAFTALYSGEGTVVESFTIDVEPTVFDYATEYALELSELAFE